MQQIWLREGSQRWAWLKAWGAAISFVFEHGLARGSVAFPEIAATLRKLTQALAMRTIGEIGIR